MKKNSLSLLVAATLASQSYAATNLDTLVVSANRISQPLTQTIAHVSVITRQQIQRSAAPDLLTLVQQLPGIASSANGGAGQTGSLFLRGSNANHLLVLVNGQRISSATVGSSAIQFIPLNQVERIELVKGPRSALYGSDAIGGILQIFTRNNRPAENFVEASIGSQQTKGFAAQLSHQYQEASHITLNASLENTDGFDVYLPSEADKDGYRNRSLALGVHHSVSPSITLDGQVNLWQGVVEYDSFFSNKADFKNHATHLKLNYTPEGRYSSSLMLASSRDDYLSYQAGGSKALGDRYVTDHQELSWLNQWQLTPSHQITAGADLLNDDVSRSRFTFDVEERDTVGLFVAGTASKDQWDYEYSLRRTDDDQFGGKTTYGLGLGWWLNDEIRLTLNQGTAYKAPTFNDLYYPFTDYGYGYSFQGNPNLKPETSRSTEIGIEGGDQIQWSLSLYDTRVDDLITYAGTTMLNTDSAQLRGVEATVAFEAAQIAHQLSVEFSNAEDRATGLQLRYRPKQSLKWQWNYKKANWSVGGDWLLVSKRYTDATHSASLPGYLLADLYSSYQLDRNWEFTGRISNLFNRHYQTSADYATAERSLKLTARYRF